MSTLIGVWKRLIPILMDDFEGFKTSVKEITAGVVEVAGELELEVRSLILSSCITFSKLLNLSGPWLLHNQKGAVSLNYLGNSVHL